MTNNKKNNNKNNTNNNKLNNKNKVNKNNKIKTKNNTNNNKKNTSNNKKNNKTNVKVNNKNNKNYFPNNKNVNKSKLIITKISLFNMMNKEMIDELVKSLGKASDLKKMTITDLTGGSGITALNLSKYFKQVNVVVSNEDTFKALEHNIKLYKVKNVKPIFGKPYELVKKLKQDIIFVHPMFKRGKKGISLYLDDKPMTEVLNKFEKDKIIVKVPFNFNFNSFLKYLNRKKIGVEKMSKYFLIVL